MKIIITEEQLSRLKKKSSFNDILFYHGRSEHRPYNGKYIYITDSLEYAAGYSGEKILYVFKIPFSESKIFTIKNKKHLDILRNITEPEGFKKILLSAGSGGEMDWGAINYINVEDNEGEELVGEEVLESLGFYGMKLNERPGIESILIFDQNKIDLINKIDITDPIIRKKIDKYNDDFFKKYKHIN